MADHEDALLATERQKADWARKLDHVSRDLKSEREKATQFQTLSQQSRAQNSGLKERLDKLASEGKAKDAEIALLKSRENKTIIEHVHVLEKAKKVTDRELAATRRERDELATLVKSLDQHKARLISDIEDMAKQNDVLRKQVRSPPMSEDEVSVQVQAERRAKVQAQNRVQELEKQLKSRGDVDDIRKQLEAAEQRNVSLKQELAALGRSKNDLPAEIRRISTSPSHTRLLQELRLNNEQLREQMSEELRRGQNPSTDGKRKSLDLSRRPEGKLLGMSSSGTDHVHSTAAPISAGRITSDGDMPCEFLPDHYPITDAASVKDEVSRLQAIVMESQKARQTAEAEKALAEDKLRQMQALVSLFTRARSQLTGSRSRARTFRNLQLRRIAPTRTWSRNEPDIRRISATLSTPLVKREPNIRVRPAGIRLFTY